MAHCNSTRTRRILRTLLSPRDLLSAAWNTGFRSRARKLDLTAFVSTLVFGTAAVARRSVQALWTAYLMAANRPMAKSAFYRWVSKPRLVPWLEMLLASVLDKMKRTVPRRLAGALGQFRDLFVPDSSVLHLPAYLAALYPGTGKGRSAAALKLHVVQEMSGGGIRTFKTTDGKASDSKHFHVGPWAEGALLLMDLGYYCFRRFARIHDLGGFFISRVKDKANPWIVRSLRTHRGQQVPVAGERLQDILGRLRRHILDCEVEVEYQARAYRGTRRGHRLALRLVGIWDQADRAYHLYFTNIPPEKLRAEQIADAYRLRWQVELFFRELKGIHKLEDLPGQKPHVIRAMILASLLAAVVTRRLVAALRARLGLDEADLPHEQGGLLMHVVAMPLLLLAAGVRRHLNALERLLEHRLALAARTLRTKRPNLQRQLQNLTGDHAVHRLIWCGV